VADVAAAVAAVYGGNAANAAAVDLNTDGSLNLRDMIALRNRLGSSLPALPPSSAAAADAILAHAAAARAGITRVEVTRAEGLSLAERPPARRRAMRLGAVDAALASPGTSHDAESVSLRAIRRTGGARRIAPR
jgi:hypothetical protein